MDVFVTGGSGYVGRQVLRALAREGHRAIALARTDAAAAVVTEEGASVVCGDLTDLSTLYAAAHDAGAAIHLAQVSGQGVARSDLAAARAIRAGLHGRPYVHTGGAWVYGSSRSVIDEGFAPQPVRYLAWRVRNERTLLSEAGHMAIVMPGIVYGHSGGLLESTIAEPARREGIATCVGDGSQHCAVVHVDDLADLYVRALQAPPGRRYAAVGDETPTLHQLVGGLAPGRPIQSLGLAAARAKVGRVADGLALDQRISNSLARRELGWMPSHTTAQTITQLGAE